MKNRIILIVSPHADDETFGCGGSIFRHIAKGDEVHWLLVTQMSYATGYTEKQIIQRRADINTISTLFGFNSTVELGLPPAKLDTIPKSEIVQKIASVIDNISPEIVYVPYRNDVHSDHEIVFDATISCCKSFRRPFIRKILAYETQSETDFCLKPGNAAFTPNYFVDISKYIDDKVRAVSVYESEVAQFPFPRSIEAMKALAMLRGSQSGVNSAESFIILKEIVK